MRAWFNEYGVLVAEAVVLVVGAAILAAVVRAGYRATHERMSHGLERGLQVVPWLRTVFLPAQLRAVAGRLHDLLWLGVTILALYVFVTSGLSLFPTTRPAAEALFAVFADPARELLAAGVAYLPNLAFIVVVVVVVRVGLAVVGAVFSAVEHGRVRFVGFPADWAPSTFSLTRLGMIALAAIVIFPYLPGAGSQAFQGVSVFVGVVLSIGGASAASNMVSGAVLTYMRPFRVGDRVKVGDLVGDVLEKSLLVTRLRTLKNEEVTMPNSSILAAQVINYSVNNERERTHPLLITSAVSLGYDVPWRKAHGLLLDAARATAGVVADPAPYVLQASFNDFSVSYTVYAAIHDEQRMQFIASELNQAIQDAFRDADVEIMSPNYYAHRDGSHRTVPAKP
jgi:small-conductance mechanosensitive channel